MGSSSVRFGLVSEDERVVGVFVGVVGTESLEGSMTMRRSVGWRACRDMLAGGEAWVKLGVEQVEQFAI